MGNDQTRTLQTSNPNGLNVLFLSHIRVNSIYERGIFTDLARFFMKQGHRVHFVAPVERMFKKPTHLIREENSSILKVKTLNLLKMNFFEKGIGALLLGRQYNIAIKKYFAGVRYDIILYSPPFVALQNVVREIKERDQAKTYLLLTDFFPQSAIDLGVFSEKNILCKYFRAQEKKLYQLADHIGCMSPAGVKYVVERKNLDKTKVEVCPNSAEIDGKDPFTNKNREVLRRYNIPSHTINYILGGNLGKPQGLDFLIDIIQSRKNDLSSYFIIVGNGTEYGWIKKWMDYKKPVNAMLMPGLRQKDYTELVRACDVGLIFLDKRFTVPHFPSRLVSYLENGLPILAATDLSTDLGEIAEKNHFGFSCINGDLDRFFAHLDWFSKNRSQMAEMGKNGYNFLLKNYTVSQAYNIIMKHFMKP